MLDVDCGGGRLRQNVANDVSFFDARAFYVEAAEGVGEVLVVDAEAMQHRDVQIAEMDRVLGDVVAEVVGATVLDACATKLPKTVGLTRRFSVKWP